MSVLALSCVSPRVQGKHSWSSRGIWFWTLEFKLSQLLLCISKLMFPLSVLSHFGRGSRRLTRFSQYADGDYQLYNCKLGSQECSARVQPSGEEPSCCLKSSNYNYCTLVSRFSLILLTLLDGLHYIIKYHPATVTPLIWCKEFCAGCLLMQHL